jgi:hypothetical protein
MQLLLVLEAGLATAIKVRARVGRLRAVPEDVRRTAGAFGSTAAATAGASCPRLPAVGKALPRVSHRRLMSRVLVAIRGRELAFKKEMTA